ncbi:hypothetical protein ACIBI8_15740 [Streptomyces sp. NPDC050529]|uniref:hypothetical protein n=1 Tax=Streptomyces sp. NPDC050529 TaxID=3365624 RepID=UPI0037920CB1
MVDKGRSQQRLVLIDATVNTAKAAHVLGCHTVFVQQPGSRAQDLVDDQSGYYSLDFTGEAYASFVDEVLRPLNPTAVVSLSAAGITPAAVANELLSTPGTPTSVLTALAEGARPAVDANGRAVLVHSFTTGGVHELVSVAPRESLSDTQEQFGPEAILDSTEREAVSRALRELLDGAGLENGFVRAEVDLSGGTPRVVSIQHHVDDDEAALLRQLTGIDLTRRALEWPLQAPAAWPIAPSEGLGGNTR